MDIKKISDKFSVAPQILASELADIKALGFVSLINNRPDGEESNQPAAAAVAAQADALGLAYQHQPVVSGQITDADISEFRMLLASAETPVLAFCRTGTRCTMLWALASAQPDNIDSLIETAAGAGYNIEGLRARMAAIASEA